MSLELISSVWLNCWAVFRGSCFPPSQAFLRCFGSSCSHSGGNQGKNGRYWRVSFQITHAVVWEGVFVIFAVQTQSDFCGSVVGEQN